MSTASALRDKNADLIEPITSLYVILCEYPTLLTEDDVAREIAGDDKPTFKERDKVEIGVRKMLSAGVLRREGDSLVPTPAVLFLDDHIGI